MVSSLGINSSGPPALSCLNIFNFFVTISSLMSIFCNAGASVLLLPISGKDSTFSLVKTDAKKYVKNSSTFSFGDCKILPDAFTSGPAKLSTLLCSWHTHLNSSQDSYKVNANKLMAHYPSTTDGSNSIEASPEPNTIIYHIFISAAQNGQQQQPTHCLMKKHAGWCLLHLL